MDLPQEYKLHKKGNVMILTHERAGIDPDNGGLFESRDPLQWNGAEESLTGGRAGLVRIRLDDGKHMLVKPLHRGGWISRFNRFLHASTARIFQEAILSSYLIEQGIRVAPVMLGRSEACGLGLFRLHLGTLEVANEGTLFDLIDGFDLSDREDMQEERACSIMRAAGLSVRSLHDAGIHHPDLNLGNLLIVSEPDEQSQPSVCILDLDRAVRKERLDPGARSANLARLYRHAAKNRLDRKSRFPLLWKSFLAGYSIDESDAVRLEKDVNRRFNRSRIFHRLSWALQGK